MGVVSIGCSSVESVAAVERLPLPGSWSPASTGSPGWPTVVRSVSCLATTGRRERPAAMVKCTCRPARHTMLSRLCQGWLALAASEWRWQWVCHPSCEHMALSGPHRPAGPAAPVTLTTMAVRQQGGSKGIWVACNCSTVVDRFIPSMAFQDLGKVNIRGEHPYRMTTQRTKAGVP